MKFTFVTIAFISRKPISVIEFVGQAVVPRSQERPSVGLPLGCAEQGKAWGRTGCGKLPLPPLDFL